MSVPNKLKMTLEGKEWEFDIIEGTEQEKGIDISKLRSTTGLITFDPGLMNTGACQSSVTFIDGEKGILQYRGYPIEDLAGTISFSDCALLLLDGELPNHETRGDFVKTATQEFDLPLSIQKLIEFYPNDGHPMGLVGAAMMSLSGHFSQNFGQKFSPEESRKILAHLMSASKTILATFYRKVAGIKEARDPNFRPSSYAEAFLYEMFRTPISSQVSKALDILLILHADHEQNCSASAVRVVASSEANIYASLAAGISALWGALHGGANEKVLQMLEKIQKDGSNVDKYIALAKDKDSSFKIMGFGHRVYKNFDPRAKIIKAACDTILKQLNVKDPLLEIALKLEKAALEDSYFKERNLYPNVDFYSGIIYKALNIPTSFFTPMFVLGRLPGWVAQWMEQIVDPKKKIVRPRQIYTGATKRKL